MFCEWDWGSTQHGVCLIADGGAVIKRWMAAHTDHELSTVLAELGTLCVVASTPIAIERAKVWLLG